MIHATQTCTQAADISPQSATQVGNYQWQGSEVLLEAVVLMVRCILTKMYKCTYHDLLQAYMNLHVYYTTFKIIRDIKL